jgi:PAS domain S-box-containing protein
MTYEKRPPGQPTRGPPGQRRAADERARLLIESVRDHAIFMLDPQGVIMSWSPGAERLHGYTEAEAVGKPLSVLYPPAERSPEKAERELSIATALGHFEEEGWRARKDGSTFWASVVVTAIRDASGHLNGFAKVTTDLTERRKAEDQLRESEERLRLLIGSIKDYAIFMLDPNGRIVTWNPGAERIKGYQAEEIIGHIISRFYTPEDLDKGLPQKLLHQAETEGRVENEGWRLRKDGTRFWADVVISAVRDSSGRLRGFAKVTRDLTERRQMEEGLLQLAQTREALRLRDEFLSIASHELKTPITTLQLQLQSVRERIEALDQRVVSKVDRATRSSEQLAQLVDSLLDVSRIATGRFELKPERFDLAESVREVIERFQDAATHAGCELSSRIEGSLLGTWDRLRIEQVLTNLLANAIKYAAGAPIEVSLARESETAILEVRDKGPGVPEAALPRIFNRFERAAPIQHYGGLGLGLYVVKEIVRAHSGMATAHNLPDGGACFSVRLPLTLSASIQETSKSGELH